MTRNLTPEQVRPKRHLSDEDVIHMREMWRRGSSLGAISRAFERDLAQVRRAVYGIYYADVALPVTVFERLARRRATCPRYPSFPQSREGYEAGTLMVQCA